MKRPFSSSLTFTGLVLVLLATLDRSANAGPQDRLEIYGPENNVFRLARQAQGPPAPTFEYCYSHTGFIPTLPLAGDFNGDGADSVGVFDLWTHEFLLSNSNRPGPPDISVAYGYGDVLPVMGDYDGDGIDTIGVRDLASGQFQLRNSNSPGYADINFFFGPADSVPFFGDFDGDGIDTPGVYISGTGEFQLRNSNSSGPADETFIFGPPGGLPLAGDWDGDGIDTVGVLFNEQRVVLYRPARPGEPVRTVPVPPSDWDWMPLAGRWESRPEGVSPATGIGWPISPPDSQDIDPLLLARAYQQADAIDDLYSLLVVRHGYLVAEQYFEGYARHTAVNVKSVSKSLLSALVGIAIRDGVFTGIQQTVAQVLPEYFPDGTDPRKAEITILNLLTMTAGLDWDEGSLDGWFASSDWTDYTLGQQMIADPGSAFLYSTGLTHVMSHMLTRASGENTDAFAKRLYDPLGISPTRWDHDHQGLLIGGAELYLTPREMARFGLLYLNGGQAWGRSIVPRNWVALTTSPLVGDAGNGRSYGGWWWIDTFADHETFFAWGYGGQFIFCIPDLDLVVVVTSRWAVSQSQNNAHYPLVFDLLENYVLPAVNP